MESKAPEHGGLKERAIKEFKLYWLITLYLFLFLGSFTVYRKLTLAEFGITYMHYGFALVEALVVAKVILIGHAMGIGRNFERGPLILSVLYKSILFGVLVILFAVCEHLVEGWFHGKRWAEITQGDFGLGLQELLARVLMMIVAFIPFFAFWEIGRAIGGERMAALFFSRQPEASPSDSRA